MGKCYCCGKDLDITGTKPEHIIPNGLGGKLKTSCILCSKCNNMLSYLDDSVCKSVLTFTNFLNPKRDNGTNPKIKICSDDKDFIRESNGKCYTETKFKNVKKEKNGLSFELNMAYIVNDKHNAKDNALRPIFNLIEDFYKNNPEKVEKVKIDVINQIEKNIEITESPIWYIQGQLNQDGLLFLGMLKIALGFCAHSKISTKYIEDKIQLLKNKDIKSVNAIGNYFYPSDFFLNDSIYHLLYLKGDSINKVMYCIISLYGILNTIILLNDNYTGENCCKTYLYDLRNNKEKTFNNHIDITQEMFASILRFDNGPQIQKEMNKQVKIFFDFLVKRNYDPDRLISIVNTTFLNICTSEFLLEEEYIEKFNSLFEKNIKRDLNFKYFLDKWIENLSDVALKNLYNYKKYLIAYVAYKIITVLTNNLFSLVIKSYPDKLSKDDCKKAIKESIDNAKTGNPTIDNIIKEQKENFYTKLEAFVENQIYPNIKIYYSMMNNHK